MTFDGRLRPAGNKWDIDPMVFNDVRPFYTPWNTKWSQVKYSKSQREFLMIGPLKTVQYMKRHNIIPLPTLVNDEKKKIGITLEKLPPAHDIVIRLDDFN